MRSVKSEGGDCTVSRVTVVTVWNVKGCSV